MKKFLGLQGLQEVVDKIKNMITSVEGHINSHISNTSNPHKVTKEHIGLNNVEDKSSETIRSEITKQNIVDGLGYTPVETQYTHPSSHPASIIAQDTTHRFVTDSEKTVWNSKANGVHIHTSNDISSLEASKITGKINIDNLPQGALERLVIVASDEERFALTTENAQKGDTVKVTKTNKMYFITDDTKLSTEDGYEIYTTGSATNVPWSGVTDKPSTFPPSSHTHDDRYFTETELNTKLSSKANTSDLTSHTGDTTSHITASERTNWNSAKTHANSTHAPSNAEPNQNAFSNIVVGSTTIAADSKTDSLNLVSGSNVQISADATNDKITISATDTKYTHPSYAAKTSGLYKMSVDATGHVNGTTPVTKADITALGIPAQDTNTNTTYKLTKSGSNITLTGSDGSATSVVDSDTNTTYGVMKGATSSAAGSQGLAPAPSAGASNRYLRSDGTWSVPPDTNTTYTLGSFGITATAAELNYIDGVTSNVQTQLNGKAPVSHSHSYLPLSGGTITGNLTTNGRILSPSLGGSWVSGMTLANASLGISTQNTSASYHPIIACKTYGSHVWNLGTITDSVGFYGFKKGRTENDTDWSFVINCTNGAVTSTGTITAPTFYGSLSGNASSATTATTATKLGTATKGSATQPVYLNAGVPTACTYTLGKSVPSNAVFTDTTYTLSSITGTLAVAKGGTGSTTAAGGRATLGASSVLLQKSEPSGQNNGDIWLKAIRITLV